MRFAKRCVPSPRGCTPVFYCLQHHQLMPLTAAAWCRSLCSSCCCCVVGACSAWRGAVLCVSSASDGLYCRMQNSQASHWQALAGKALQVHRHKTVRHFKQQQELHSLRRRSCASGTFKHDLFFMWHWPLCVIMRTAAVAENVTTCYKAEWQLRVLPSSQAMHAPCDSWCQPCSTGTGTVSMHQVVCINNIHTRKTAQLNGTNTDLALTNTDATTDCCRSLMLLPGPRAWPVPMH